MNPDELLELKEGLSLLKSRIAEEDAAKQAAAEEEDRKGYTEKFGRFLRDDPNGEIIPEADAILRGGMDMEGANWKTATEESIIENIIKPVGRSMKRVTNLWDKILDMTEEKVEQVLGDAPIVEATPAISPTDTATDMPPDVGPGQPAPELGAGGAMPPNIGVTPPPMDNPAMAPSAPSLIDPNMAIPPAPMPANQAVSGIDVSSFDMKNIKPKALVNDGLDADMKLINRALKEMKI